MIGIEILVLNANNRNNQQSSHFVLFSEHKEFTPELRDGKEDLCI